MEDTEKIRVVNTVKVNVADEKDKKTSKETEISNYVIELKSCRDKLRGYEMLSEMYKESVDQCRTQKFEMEKLQQRLKLLEKLSPVTTVRMDTSNTEWTELSEPLITNNSRTSEESNLLYSVEQQGDCSAEVKDQEQGTNESKTKWKQLEVFCQEVVCKSGVSCRKSNEEGKDATARRSQSSSSGTSFVKIQGDDEEGCGSHNEDYEDIGLSDLNLFEISEMENELTMIEAKIPSLNLLKVDEEADFETPPDDCLRRFLEKLGKVSENPHLGNSKELTSDLMEVTARTFKVYKQALLLQNIMEDMEKENRFLRAQLDRKQSSGRQERKVVESSIEDSNGQQDKISELLSAKEALLMMLSKKDQQLAQAKQHLSILKTRLSKMELSYNKATTCLQQNSLKWQKDYNRLEERCKKAEEERDHEKSRRSKTEATHSTMKEEVARLRGRIEEMKVLGLVGEAKVIPSEYHSATEMDILKQQISIYEEDFKNERRDREKAQTVVESLQKRLDQLSVTYTTLSKSYMKLKEDNKILEERFSVANSFIQTNLTSPPRLFHHEAQPTAIKSFHHNHPIFTHGSSPSAPHEESFVPSSSSWRCSSCTFINDSNFIYCNACQAKKF